MPNSDNTFGTHNKQTKIISQIDDGSTILTVFADVAAAKAFFFTDEALAVMDECCTILEWALVNDGNGEATALKRTFAFGTKGDPNIASEDECMEEYEGGLWDNLCKLVSPESGTFTDPVCVSNYDNETKNNLLDFFNLQEQRSRKRLDD